MIRAVCILLWALAGPAAAQDAKLSARVLDLLARSEAAADAGDAERAQKLLAEADALARKPGAHGTAGFWAPTVLQAERFADVRNFDEAWRFADAAATGLNQAPYSEMDLAELWARTALVQGRVTVETRDMVAAADYLATALVGPLDPDEALRARALRALALGFMGATETQAAFDALGPMMTQRDELVALLGPVDYLLLIYQQMDLLRGYDPPPHLIIAFWADEMIARLDAGAGHRVGRYLEANYRAEAGLALSQAGRQAEAGPQLARAVEILMADWPDSRVAWRARYFEAFNLYTGGKHAAAAKALARMVADDGPGADAEFLSYALQGQGTMAGPGPEAQALFRRAYEVALRSFDRDSVQVQHAAGFIDPADPGFAGWIHAADIRPEIAAEALDGRGTAILRAYLAGDHHVFEAILAEAEARLAPHEVEVNAALAAALRGEPDAALSRLRTLRAGGQEVPPGVLDRIEIVALLWGSQHRREEAGPAIARLSASEPEAVMGPVARAYLAMLQGDWRARDVALADWAARFDPGPEPGPWDVMAALMIAEVGGAMGAVAEGQTVVAQIEAYMDRTTGLDLARDFVAFAPFLAPRNGARADEGLDEAIALATRLRQAFPPGTAIATTLPVTQARFERQRGNFAVAERLYRDAIEAASGNPKSLPEVEAMMRGELAVLLTQQGRMAEAVPLVQQVEQALRELEMSPGFRNSMTGTVSWVRLRLDGPEAGLAAWQDTLARPGFVESLQPIDRFTLLGEVAGLQAQSGQPEAAQESLALARRALANSGSQDPTHRARLLYNEALVAFWAGQAPAAYGAITRSNDLYFEIRARVARQSPGGVAAPLPDDTARAFAEAYLGWVAISDGP